MKIYAIVCLLQLLPAAALAFEGQEQPPAPVTVKKPADASQSAASPPKTDSPKPNTPVKSKSAAVDKDQQYLEFLTGALKNASEQPNRGK